MRTRNKLVSSYIPTAIAIALLVFVLALNIIAIFRDGCFVETTRHTRSIEP